MDGVQRADAVRPLRAKQALITALGTIDMITFLSAGPQPALSCNKLR